MDNRISSVPDANANAAASEAPWPALLDWCHGDTHAGRVREGNEDNYLCDPQRKLFIVADGMGGHSAGEEASRIAIDQISNTMTLGSLLHDSSDGGLAAKLSGALEVANAEVICQGESNFDWHGMGTTAVIVVLHKGGLHVANIGDSRAYLWRGETLRQLSRDHSVAAVLAEQEHITPEQARSHPMRNRLTACLGIDPQIRPDTNCVPLEAGDRILLCSDGLWDMLSDEDIASHLVAHATPSVTVEALIQAANDAGGKDNITVVVLHVRQDVLSLLSPPASSSVFEASDPDEAPPTSSEDTVILRD